MPAISRRRFLAGSAGSLLLAGCGRGGSSAPEFGGAPAHMVMNPIMTFMPWMIALERGLFAARQIEFDAPVAQMPSATVIQQLTGNQLQFSLTNPSSALNNALLRGAPLVVLGAHSITTRGYPDSYVVVSNQAWDAGVRTPADLRGREINIPFGVDSGFGQWIVKLLAREGMTKDDVKITGWGEIGQLYQAVSAGNVEIAGISEPGLTQVKSRGTVHLMPGSSVDEVRDGTISLYVLTNRDWLKAYPEAAVRVLMARIEGGRAYTQAQDNGWRDPPDVAAIIQKSIKITPDVLAQTKGNKVNADLLFDAARAQEAMEFFQSIGSVAQIVPVESYIDQSYAREALARLQKEGK
jgi:NitT/TauT family transport system substrate-binding protein